MAIKLRKFDNAGNPGWNKARYSEIFMREEERTSKHIESLLRQYKEIEQEYKSEIESHRTDKDLLNELSSCLDELGKAFVTKAVEREIASLEERFEEAMQAAHRGMDEKYTHSYQFLLDEYERLRGGGEE